MTDKSKLIWAGGIYLAFVLGFWFLGKPHEMGPLTAYVALCGLHLVYAGIMYVINKILWKKA